MCSPSTRSANKWSVSLPPAGFVNGCTDARNLEIKRTKDLTLQRSFEAVRTAYREASFAGA